MRYGYFDDAAREYVIDRVDVPQSMTNYLGTQRMGAVISHNAGGYCWLDSPQHHRITRFRPNGVPMDRPGRRSGKRPAALRRSRDGPGFRGSAGLLGRKVRRPAGQDASREHEPVSEYLEPVSE